MHDRGIVHRDVKPGNLLIGRDGYVKLCDYGLSKFLRKGETTSTFLGTLAYIPPELVNGDLYDHSTDLWSLGISLYEMCYGSTPFEPCDVVSSEEWAKLTKRNIVRANLRLSAGGVGLPARLFLKSLLARDKRGRLGCAGNSGIDYRAVMGHPVFAKLDWSALERRELKAPHDGDL